MPWNGSSPNQTFGRTDGTRTGSTVWQQAAAASVNIVDTFHDTHDEDIGDAIDACLKKDGGNTVTADIPMGGYNFTNMGAAAGPNESARLADVNTGDYAATVGGTADAITLTTGKTFTAYAAGQRFTFLATATNTGAMTVNVDAIGVKDLTAPAAVALSAGQVLTAGLYTIIYDGTRFQLTSYAPAAIPVGTVVAWPTATVPTGFLYCDGSAVSRTTYSALFNVIGTEYGVGNGSSTFNVPDYEDYFLRGFDASGTEASSRTDRGDGTTGASVGTKQAGAFLRHNHGVTDAGHTHSLNNATNVHNSNGSGNLTASLTSSLAVATITANTATTGITIDNTSTGDSTSETRAKNATVKWCIVALPSAAIPVGSANTVSPRTCHTGSAPAQVSGDGTNATPSVTETYICEIFIPAPTTVTGIALFNGDAVAGNVILALANSLGAVVAQTASTAQSGTDAYQRVPFSSSYAAVGPGTFYVLAQFNNTSARFNTHTFGNFGASKKTGETFGTFTTVTAPSTFTTALGPIASLY